MQSQRQFEMLFANSSFACELCSFLFSVYTLFFYSRTKIKFTRCVKYTCMREVLQMFWLSNMQNDSAALELLLHAIDSTLYLFLLYLLEGWSAP